MNETQAAVYGEPGEALQELPRTAGAFTGVDAHGLSGWIERGVTPVELTLMHGDAALLTIVVQPEAPQGDRSDDAAIRTHFRFDLAAVVAATREANGGDKTAEFSLFSSRANLPGLTPPLSASDLSLLSALLAETGEPALLQPSGPWRGALAAVGRLAAGLRRNGPARMIAFATMMVAQEGIRGAARFAVLSRAQRQQRLIERRRAQHSAIAVALSPARMELQEQPSASDPFETAIFRNWPDDASSQVPLIGYQHFALARLRYNGALNTDAEREAGLMWYIETYSPFRHPFKVPFSGHQIAWLLDLIDVGAAMQAPRVVHWFLQAKARLDHKRSETWSPARVAYWWCLQKAVDLNVEHALLPESFIDQLRSPTGEARNTAPSCEFLHQYFASEPSFVAELESSAGRFVAYVRLLMAEGGLHFGLFMPDGVLELIARLAEAIAPGADVRFDGQHLRALALAAIDHRQECARIRRSGVDLSAARLSQDWVAAAAAADAIVTKTAPRAQGTPKSALPFPVRVIGPLNSRSGLGQASRLSIAALQAVGVAVETVDFLLDNPAPRGGYFPNDFSLAPGFGVNLLHLSGESLPLAAAFMAPEFFAGKANIGYFFWELPHPAECHELALQQLDELWVASNFNRDIYTPYMPDSVFRVGMALEPVRTPFEARSATRRRFGLSQTAFVFVTTFDSFSFISRKNPAASIRAFRAAFPLGSEDVNLVVKTHNLMRTLGEARADMLRAEILRLCASDPRIILINETFSHEELLTLKSSCDAYVSLHRSEGWGFGMVESMQLGLPVIATAFSGNLDFCTEETSWLVDYEKVGLAPDEYIFVRSEDYWAEPDLESAAACMRRAVADPRAAAAKGAAARRYVQANLSPDAVGAVYLKRLETLAHTWARRAS